MFCITRVFDDVIIKDSNGNVLVTTSIIILDYSLTPTFTAVFATNSSGTNTFTSIDDSNSLFCEKHKLQFDTNFYWSFFDCSVFYYLILFCFSK